MLYFEGFNNKRFLIYNKWIWKKILNHIVLVVINYNVCIGLNWAMAKAKTYTFFRCFFRHYKTSKCRVQSSSQARSRIRSHYLRRVNLSPARHGVRARHSLPPPRARAAPASAATLARFRCRIRPHIRLSRHILPNNIKLLKLLLN